jgi:hypothetical protein
MKAGAQYGLLLGILMFAFDRLNSPAAWAIFWATQAILLSINAKLTWQRTGLIWMTLGGVHAALFSATLVPASILGFTLRNLPAPWNVVFYANALAMPVWFFAAKSVHREQFRRWDRHMEPMAFHHIPHLR